MTGRCGGTFTASAGASLGIIEILDFDTVLQGLVNCARTLTASRYGVITTRNGSGRPPEFVTTGRAP